MTKIFGSEWDGSVLRNITYKFNYRRDVAKPIFAAEITAVVTVAKYSLGQKYNLYLILIKSIAADDLKITSARRAKKKKIKIITIRTWRLTLNLLFT